MPRCRIDHITVTAPALAAGHDFVLASLGVAPQPGGEHPRMGTHNLLLRLGDAMFLEVIAIDPNAALPSRPRWFGLDRRGASSLPELSCWVARTPDIAASLRASPVPLGLAEPMTRGALEWLISIPGDGSLPMSGAAPSLIEWHVARHPAATLPNAGCKLRKLELHHPDAPTLASMLAALQLDEPGVSVSVYQDEVPGLVAHVDTPRGLRRIGGAPMA